MKIYLSALSIFFTVMLVVTGSALAQPTCDNPYVIIDDNFDSYTLGPLGPQAGHWTTWSGNEGGSEDGIVTDDLGSNALKIEGQAGGGPQDVLLKLGDKTSGMYIVEWEMLIPGGAAGYYNIQHFEAPGMEWAIELTFATNGIADLDVGGATYNFTFPFDEFFNVRHIIDLDNDRIYLYVDGGFVRSWTFSWQAGSANGTKQLGAVDFYPTDGDNFYYVDNVVFAEVAPAEDGRYCHLAIPVDVGTHTISELDCFGAGFTVRSAGQGLAGAWYSFTAPEDGVMSVSSCEMGADSRVWIFSGGCESLDIEGVNDDRCLVTAGGGDEYASYREVLVNGGQTYLICWDDIWEATGFDFVLDFMAGSGAEGDFCETAFVVGPGTHTIDQINGDAAVAGPDINHTSASTTNYAQSEWYSFTPDSDGKMTVSSCDVTTEDTRLWIYTGECGIESLELVASSDDSCGLQSRVFEMDVAGGTTYYIEWDSEDTDAPGFDWNLDFEPFTSTEEDGFSAAFQVNPNPATGAAQVSYNFAESTDLEISVFNAQGQLMNSTHLGLVLSGTHQLDLSALPSGLYMVVMSNGTEVATKKLMVE